MSTSTAAGSIFAKTYPSIDSIKPLDAKLDMPDAGGGCGTTGGEGKASGGSSGDPTTCHQPFSLQPANG